MDETSHAPLKRLMLYHHFDRDNIIDPHILYQIRAYRACGIDIVFLSNSDLPGAELKKLDGLVLETVLHGNRGFDFGAWQAWLRKHGPDALKAYDRFLLANCSCYGPLFPPEEMFSAMEAKNCDFWGITDYENDRFPAHVQSYFLCFRPQVFLSEAFWGYWNAEHDYQTFDLAIREGEVGFCTALTDAGFRWEAYCDLHDDRVIWSLSYYPSYSFSIPDFLIARYRIPLIKIKGFISENKYPMNKAGLIMRSIRKSGSSYPPELITDHQRRTEPLSWQRELPETLLVSDFGAAPEKRETALKIAVTVHLESADRTAELLDWLRNIPYPFDLLLSVPSEELAADFRQRLRSCGARETVIRTAGSQGDGTAAWLTVFRDLQSAYDLVLRIAFPDPDDEPEFVHYALRLHRRASLAASPRQTGDIVAAFEREPRLGLVFPSFPAVQM